MCGADVGKVRDGPLSGGEQIFGEEIFRAGFWTSSSESFHPRKFPPSKVSFSNQLP